ncbi:MAG: sigma-70 family RNA polymerase sigma factor [Planctomycetota bacterium]
MGDASPVGALVEHLFRREYTRLVAGLVRVLGPGRLETAEEVVQEALYRALRTWPLAGVPDDPCAWLLTVARNRALDRGRHARLAEAKLEELGRWREESDSEEEHDALRLIFACCHPALAFDSRVALTLKVACGLATREIARALLASEEAVAQRILRARTRLAQPDVALEVPDAEGDPARLDAVLEVLYLLFNEGYATDSGASPVRAELVHEALRLGELLAASPTADAPRLRALLALLYFQGARLAAREDEHGATVPLARQERARWDRRWLAAGWRHFERAAAGGELSPFHVEAAIAAEHARAPSYAATDWAALDAHYATLTRLVPSPIVTLNHAVVLAKLHGPLRALVALQPLVHARELEAYFPLHVTLGLLRWHAGDRGGAERAWRRALDLPSAAADRKLLEHRLSALQRGEAPEAF